MPVLRIYLRQQEKRSKHTRTNTMKKEERKVLRGKLLIAIKKVLKDNKDVLKSKTEKAIIKAIKEIARKTDKKIIITSKRNISPAST